MGEAIGEAIALCATEFVLRLLAARATPVGREVFERHAVMLGRVVDVAADGANVFASWRLEDDFAGVDHGGRVVEVYDALCFEAFERLGYSYKYGQRRYY